MTRSELTLLTECGHDLAAKVALAIIAAAQVGPCNMEVQVDMDTLETIGRTLKMHIEHDLRVLSMSRPQYCLIIDFMEVDAVIYARVQR